MSKPRVTITLGHGQVVRRGGDVVNDGDLRDYRPPLSGTKRSIKDRLGSNGGSSSSKRQRGHGSGLSSGNNGVDGLPVGPDDLRLKLLRKKVSKNMHSDAESHRGDLREMLSRKMRPSASVDMRQRSKREESRGSRQPSSIRSTDNLVQMKSPRRPYSSMTTEPFRSRSPDRVMENYRGLSAPRYIEERRTEQPRRPIDVSRNSPPRYIDEMRREPTRRPIDTSVNSPVRNYDVLRQVPVRRTMDASRNGLLTGNVGFDPSRPRPIGTSSITMHAALEIPKPVSRMLPPPTTNSLMQRSLYMGDNIADLLHSLGLGKYYINFQAEEVDMTALRQMADQDLKDMGIPMGPRKKILLAIKPPSKRPPP